LGWSERDFYESSPESVHNALQGYFNKRKADERLLRNVAWINYKVNGGTSNQINDIWPIDEKKEVMKKVWGESPEEVKENYERILAAHRVVKHQKVKNG
jgi:hypothetical protein